MITVRSATVALFALTAVLSTCVLLSNTASTGATAPTPPAGCYVASEPLEAGPAAPSDLTVAYSPAYLAPAVILDATEDIDWTDNSQGETCFVLEMAFEGGEFEPFKFFGANAEDFYWFSGYGRRDYRIYASTPSARSEYSNVASVDGGPIPRNLPRGDLNCDLVITPDDVMSLITYQAEIEMPHRDDCPRVGGYATLDWSEPATWGDLDCNRKVEAIDTIILLGAIAELSKGLTEPCPDVGQEQLVNWFR